MRGNALRTGAGALSNRGRAIMHRWCTARPDCSDSVSLGVAGVRTVPSGSRLAMRNVMRYAPNSVDMSPIDVRAGVPIAYVGSAHSVSHVPVKPSFEVMMVSKRLRSVMRSAQYPPRLPCQCLNRRMRCDMATTRYLVSDVADGAPSDARHCTEQMTRLGISVKRFRNRTDPSGQLGRRPA
jgi:hypothetical protein